MVNAILRTAWAVRFIGGARHIVGSTKREGYAEFWTPDTYALLYVAADGRGTFSIQKRLCTSVTFTTVLAGIGTPEQAQAQLLAHAGRLSPRHGVLPRKFVG